MAGRKKILIIANSSGGLAMFRAMLIQRLEEEYEVVAAVPLQNRVDELTALGCRLIDVRMERRGQNPLRDLAFFRQCRAVIRQEKPDFVITYTIKPNIYGGLAARLAHVPYAANVTGLGTAFDRAGLLKKLVVIMQKTGLKGAKTVFFENAVNRDIFVRERIVPQERTCVLSGAGVDLARFPCQPYPAEAEPMRFLFIGRGMREKGVDELFEAFRRLRGEGCNCVLDMVGRWEESYKDRIAAGETEGWLRTHGFQSDVKPFIREAHCAVLPSWHEGMANTNLECAASGRPLITSDIPGCREAVIPGVSGLTCRVKDADDLYAKLREMAGYTNEQRAKMGLAGRRHMEEVFDKRKVVEKTVTTLFG